ncbi:integral inner membrane protein; glycosyl transferase [Bacillus subtilis]|nr:YycA [Bacillus velezensis SQR9]AIW39423.1 integral inner membrane protein; glycosyl transferase [Bacillus subtilis]AWD13861.1 hypothetical protein B9C53_10485 [Bacillus velezensis]
MCGRRKRWLSASFFRKENFGKTVSQLKKLVDEGKVKYFLLSGNSSGNTKLVSWIKKNGTKISADPYSTEKTSSARQGMTGGPGGQSQQTLYQMKK